MNSFQTLFYFNSSVDISWLPTFEQLRFFFMIVFSDAEDNGYCKRFALIINKNY